MLRRGSIRKSPSTGTRQTSQATPIPYYGVSIKVRLQRNQTALVRWIDALELKTGDRAFHLGCGSGYCPSIIAEVVGPMAVLLVSRWTRGIMTKIVRHHGAYSVEMVSTVVIFSGGQLRDSALEPLMANTLRSGAC